MTGDPITDAAAQIEFALTTLITDPPVRIFSSIASPVVPPAVVIGPPRTPMARAYNSEGPISAQWMVYLVAPINEYAMDWLNKYLHATIAAIERWTPGVVIASTPGTFPSPTGMLPAHIITVATPLTGANSYC